MADPSADNIIAPSQGIHLVFDASFLASDSAIMVPHTADGRVMFAIPWHGHTVVGTTDTPIGQPALEPIAMEEEIEFILQTAALYLDKPPTRADILSIFAGIRPLVKGDAGSTAALSRDHTIRIENSGLITVCGGKWTTYRRMAEDCVNQAATLGRLPEKPCVTEHLNIHGFHTNPEKLGRLRVYGSDAAAIGALGHSEPLHPCIAVHRRRSDLGRAARDGKDRGRCSGPAHPRSVSQCESGVGDGSPSSIVDGQGTGARQRLGSRSSTGIPQRCRGILPGVTAPNASERRPGRLRLADRGSAPKRSPNRTGPFWPWARRRERFAGPGRGRD